MPIYVITYIHMCLSINSDIHRSTVYTQTCALANNTRACALLFAFNLIDPPFSHLENELLIEHGRQACSASARLVRRLDSVHGRQDTRLHPHLTGVGGGAAPLRVPGGRQGHILGEGGVLGNMYIPQQALNVFCDTYHTSAD